MPMAGSTPQNVSGGAGGGDNNPTSNGVSNNNNNPAGVAAAAAVSSNKTWELSDYELHRTPQEAVTDGSEIAVSPRALHSELMCPICLDMLNNTMTTKECLHRFCAECIITALRSGNKECPTCRKKLVSKRSLRHDPNFDQLISKIYPSRDEYEAQQQKAMAKLSKSHNQLALSSSVEEALKQQALRNKAKLMAGGKGGAGGEAGGDVVDVATNESLSTLTPTNGLQQATQANSLMNMSNNSMSQSQGQQSQQHPIASNGPGPAPVAGNSSAGVGPITKISRTDSAGGDNSSVTSGYSEEVTEVELVFKPHPEMVPPTSSNTTTPGTSASASTTASQTRFIKTTANASVEHLTKYLAMRLQLDSQPQPSTTGLDEASTSVNNFTIFVSPFGDNYVTIQQNQTLAQVCERFWRFNKPLELYYSIKK